MTKRFSGLLLLSLVLSGCSGKKDGDKKDGDTTPKPNDAKDADKKGPEPKSLGKADVTLTSLDFASEFKGDAAKEARKKYSGKVVELTGILRNISLRTADGAATYWLKTEEFAPGVMCGIAGKNPWTKALPGQTVTLKGKGQDRNLACLEECEIVDVKGDGPKAITAEALAEEQAKDPKANNKKYERQQLLIEGEVVKVEPDENMVMVITLKTGKPMLPVLLSLQEADWARAKGFKAGQKVKALGEFFSLSDKDKVYIFQTILLDPAR